MRPVTRRHAFILASAVAAHAITPRAFALEPAKSLEQVWPEVRAGSFEVAVQRLQVHVTEWPLDRAARSNLAMLQFATETFDKAEENFRRVVKLQRAMTPSAGPRFDMDYLEAWYYLSQLRAGRTPDMPPFASAYSLLSILTGKRDVQGFAAKAADAYFVYLDGVQDMMRETTVTRGGATATVKMHVERPDRDAVERSYLCIGHFTLGEQALGLGDRAAGRDSLSVATAIKAEDAFEHHVAKVELTRLAAAQ